MPAPVARPKKGDEIWSALQAHIKRERQKKKEAQEADAEVERQRKERERQQKQDVMTLGETNMQIQQHETRLTVLKEEKHQLFLTLKKVLNEDDLRRRQLMKESEMMGMHAYTPNVMGGHASQLFLQPTMLAGRSATVYKLPPPGHTLLPSVNQYDLLASTPPRGTIKRPRSPSPTPGYHPGYGYKHAAVSGYSQPKMEEGRRGHDMARAVLWNKNNPTVYGTSQPAFYNHPPPSSTSVSYAPTSAVYSYSNSSHPQYVQQSQGVPPPPSREDIKHGPPALYLHSQPGPSTQPGPSRVMQQQSQSAYVALHQSMEHSGQKSSGYSSQEAEKYYSGHPPGVSIRPATHVVPIHGGSIPVQQLPQGAKSGGITSGYPIRGQPVSHVNPVTTYQQMTTVSTPHSVYVSQAPGTRISYSQAALHHPGHPPPHGAMGGGLTVGHPVHNPASRYSSQGHSREQPREV
ncbi:G protein pathway suppressor 2 [Cloeon dipterum]|uniref:G protein pathway suppressor 2 n=1 Tax=Cloeon dipterum TaxID=197152 RepID=UPI00321F910D